MYENVSLQFPKVEVVSNPKDKRMGRRYRNFAGVPTGNYDSTQRYFNIRVPDDRVEELERLNIDVWRPRNPDETGYFPTFVQVSVGTRKNNPNELNCDIYLVTGNNPPRRLDGETVGIIDDMYLRFADVACGVAEKKNKPGEFKLWCNVVYVYQNTRDDPFAYQFENSNYEDLPF